MQRVWPLPEASLGKNLLGCFTKSFQKQPGLWCAKYHSLVCSACPRRIEYSHFEHMCDLWRNGLRCCGEIPLRSLVMHYASFDIKEDKDGFL